MTTDSTWRRDAQFIFKEHTKIRQDYRCRPRMNENLDSVIRKSSFHFTFVFQNRPFKGHIFFYKPDLTI